MDDTFRVIHKPCGQKGRGISGKSHEISHGEGVLNLATSPKIRSHGLWITPSSVGKFFKTS